MTTQTYGDLIRVSTGNRASAEVLQRVPLGAGTASGGIYEYDLEDLLFRYPGALPIDAIDSSYAGTVPICRQLALPAGYADALYVNQSGRLTLAEFKMWHNPQARREVIGQILDYAKDLASWGYEDLQRQVSLASGKRGNALYDLVRERWPDVKEAEFVDNVTRHLRRGEFLLLIIGDGIQEGAANIVDFVRRYSGLHFNLAMVEAALYRDAANRLIVQPRVLARTEIVQRFVVDGGLVTDVAVGDVDEQQEALSDQDEENLRFWSAVLRDYSFADMTLEMPSPTKDSVLFIRVRNTGFGGWALCFAGYLHRSASNMGCYLSVRKDQGREVRVFDELAGMFEELRAEISDDLAQWINAANRPRIGFSRQGRLSFLAGGEAAEEFGEAVAWMRDHLNRLVSGLNPRVQSMLGDER